MSSPLLQVEDLTKIFYSNRFLFFFKPKFAPYTAVSHISFRLNEGEILGILGPNGAGKTTTIEMLLGILKPTSGKISFFGQDLFKHRSSIIQQVTHASAYHKFPNSLTVQENLEIVGGLYRIPKQVLKKRLDTYLAQFRMEEARHKQAGSLSAGQITRIMLIKAFLPEPRIILLDEPTASLDPDIASETRSFILKQQKERRLSIILTSHNMQEVSQVCDRAIVMQKGMILEEDTPEKLAKSASLTKVHFKISKNMERALPCMEENRWHYKCFDGELLVELDESHISLLLKKLIQSEVEFSYLDIEKPTLEDYFLRLKGGI